MRTIFLSIILTALILSGSAPVFPNGPPDAITESFTGNPILVHTEKVEGKDIGVVFFEPNIYVVVPVTLDGSKFWFYNTEILAIYLDVYGELKTIYTRDEKTDEPV